METLQGYTHQHVRAVCRDIDERWLEEGRNKAMELGLSNVTFEKGDALDAASFGSLSSRPHIMVSSGFYDWMEDDTMVIRSMKVISRVLRPNGYFVFTNQCGHADLDMVNDVFTGFDGKPLKMTVRSPRRVNQMAVAAGFRIAETTEDRWGYYSVTAARLIG